MMVLLDCGLQGEPRLAECGRFPGHTLGAGRLRLERRLYRSKRPDDARAMSCATSNCRRSCRGRLRGSGPDSNSSNSSRQYSREAGRTADNDDGLDLGQTDVFSSSEDATGTDRKIS